MQRQRVMRLPPCARDEGIEVLEAVREGVVRMQREHDPRAVVSSARIGVRAQCGALASQEEQVRKKELEVSPHRSQGRH